MTLNLPPLAPEVLFNLWGLPITNTIINSWLAIGVFFVFGLVVKISFSRLRLDDAPKGLTNFTEWLVENVLSYVDQVTGNRDKSLKFLPLVASLFIFILLANWMGLIPGTGSIGIWGVHEGHKQLLPLFRPANSDLNLTLVMAVIGVVSSHILGVIAVGFWAYAGKFIKIYPLWQAIKHFNFTAILVAIIEIFAGFLEIFSEITKMASLSLRLFGNIFAGEVLLTVIGSLVAFLIPLPFMALELLVGLVQAVVFSMLVLVYLNMATEPVPAHKQHN